MGLYDRMKSDNNRILSGSDMQDVTVTNALGVSTIPPIKARVTAVGMGLNMQGLPVVSKKYSVSFSLDEVVSLMSTSETFENWKASFLNSQSETVSGVFNNPFVDKTLNYLVATLTNIKVSA